MKDTTKQRKITCHNLVATWRMTCSQTLTWSLTANTNLSLILKKKDGSSQLNSILEDIDIIFTKMWKKQRSKATQLMCDPATEGCFIGAC